MNTLIKVLNKEVGRCGHPIKTGKFTGRLDNELYKQLIDKHAETWKTNRNEYIQNEFS